MSFEWIYYNRTGNFRPVLNMNKPAGPDGVSPRLLKDIAYSISKQLTKFFNMSLSIKQVPLL